MKSSYQDIHYNVPVATVIGVESCPPPPTAPTAPAMATAAGGALVGVQNEGGAREFLSEFHWPESLQETFLRDVARVPLRYFICDDSGSMQANDGKKVVDVNGIARFVACSRWSELTTALRFHVGLAHAGLIPTEFRLLNGAAPFRIGYEPQESAHSISTLCTLFDDSPSGGTPLCRHVREIVAQIRLHEPALRAASQKACIIIATDGESSDGDVAEALKPLKDLPCFVVVRLCTDEAKVVDYWNHIDNILELNVDVLDDLQGESKEIRSVNPWITYAEPLHRMREFGVSLKEVDLLDESLLPKEQMKKVCRLLYGSRQVDALPAPEVDMAGFVKGIHALNSSTPRVWSPADLKLRHWVDDAALGSAYGVGGCTIM